MTEENEQEDDIEKLIRESQKQKDEEVQELLSRINALEQSGQEDETLVGELAKRGIAPKALQAAWQQHIEDFPEHGHQEEALNEFIEQEDESLEQRLADANARNQEANNLYSIQNRLEEGAYVSNDELYNALEQTQMYVSEQGGLSDNQYQALNKIQDTLAEPGYIGNRAFEDLKTMGKLKIGDSYINSDKQRL